MFERKFTFSQAWVALDNNMRGLFEIIQKIII